MEEENDDLMSLFESNNELLFDNFEDIKENEIKNNEINNIDAVDDDNQEEVDGDEGKQEEGEEVSNDESDSSPTLFSSVADILKEQGFLPSLDSSINIKSVEDFSKALNDEISIQAKAMSDEYLSNLDLDKIVNSRQENLQLESIDENYLKENIEIAKNIIFQDYINQGLSEERAIKLIKKTVDLGEDILIEDALESKKSIQDFNLKQEKQAHLDAQKQLREEKEEQIRIEQNIKKLIFESKELIKGVAPNKTLQDKVYKSMTDIISKNAITGELENSFLKERNLNPLQFDVKMYYAYVLTDGFNDFTKLMQKGKSSAVKDLEMIIRQPKQEDNGTPYYMQDPNSYDSPFGSELVL